MKNLIKYLLQTLLGFKNYLYVFSIFKIKTLKTDPKEKDFFYFLDLLSPTDTVLDIGANIGIMTFFLSKKLVKGQVHSFEPIPDNFSILQRIVKRYNCKNVKLHDYALGDKNTSVEMVLPVVNAVKMQGLSHVIHESIDTFNDGEVIKVESSKLDSVFSNEKVDAIKIDVENFEFYTLQGGIILLEKYHPKIYIELWENENRNQCFELLKGLGYAIYVVQNNELAEYDSSLHPQQNFIAIKKG